MNESTSEKYKRILNALLQGRKITPFDANEIGRTTDGTRYIRYIREKYPVKSEKVEGQLYRKYWMDEEYLAQLKQVGNEVNAGTFFKGLTEIMEAGIFKQMGV